MTRVALKFGNYLKGGTVAIGADTRKTSFALKSAIVSGLNPNRMHDIRSGYSSTPSVFKEVAINGLDGGIMVTASHNPPAWNGIKFVIRPGRGVFEPKLNPSRTLLLQARRGMEESFPVRSSYPEILRNKDWKRLRQGSKCTLDLAGGVGSLFIPQLITYQGCMVHSLHSTPGIFPRIMISRCDSW